MFEGSVTRMTSAARGAAGCVLGGVYCRLIQAQDASVDTGPSILMATSSVKHIIRTADLPGLGIQSRPHRSNA